MELEAQFEVLWHVLLAGLLGAAIGAEREWKGKAAGLRTHILVAAGSALIIGISQQMIVQFTNVTPGDVIRADPTRVLEAIIVGVGVLGGGTIIFQRQHHVVRGLTTAASLLLVAALGIAVAVHAVYLALGITAVAVLVLHAVGRIEDGWESKRTTQEDLRRADDEQDATQETEKE